MKVNEIKEVLNKYTSDGSNLKVDLTFNELEEVKKALIDGLWLSQREEKPWQIISNRLYLCWIGDIEQRQEKIKKDESQKSYVFNLKNIKAEKPNEIIEYKETIFTPNETEADYKISQSEDNTEDNWEFEEYDRQQKEKERDYWEETNWEMENVELVEPQAQIQQLPKKN